MKKLCTLTAVALFMSQGLMGNTIYDNEYFCQDKAISTHRYLLSKGVDHYLSYSVSEAVYNDCMTRYQ